MLVLFGKVLSRLLPNEKSFPSVSMINETPKPAEISLTTPGESSIFRNYDVTPDLPSSPLLLFPEEKTLPELSSARQWKVPGETYTIYVS